MTYNPVDFTGQTFGGFLVLGPTKERIYRTVVWKCKCIPCGKIVKRQTAIVRKAARSCGCSASTVGRVSVAKGIPRSQVQRLYSVWVGMISRCTDPKATAFEHYGGRGITVCKRWHTFDNFVTDMHPRPPRHQLDRKNNDGNYTKSNCRWVTSAINHRNMRTNVYYKIGNKEKILGDWCADYGISVKTVFGRLSRGWPLTKALKTPVDTRFRVR